MADIIVTEKDIARFWAKTRRNEATGCLEWTAARHPSGYGTFSIGGRRTSGGSPRAAHRVAWVIANGAIPDGLCVCHRCDNPPCVDPAHLFLGTLGDNYADMAAKGREARGDRLGTHTHPESRPTGSAHWARRIPERTARGERQGFAKLTEQAVREMRSLRAQGMTLADLARRYGVSPRATRAAVTRETWAHVS